MLCQFVFENFKSFKSEAFLDFIAEPISDNADSLIIDKIDSEKFLPVISIYGPNGGGKSTVLEALNYLRIIIIQKVILSQADGNEKDDDISELIKMASVSKVKEKYHKFDPKCKDYPTSFDILFRVDDREYRYQISLIQDKITEENLYMKFIGKEEGAIIFERSDSDYNLGEILEGIAVEKLKNTMPLISHIAINYEIDIIDKIVSWFLNINIVDYDNPLKEKRILIPKTEERKKQLFELLKTMDINISDFRLEKDIDGSITGIFTKHMLPNGMIYEIPFEEESSGTRKLFSCLAEILNCLQNGGLMIADELDAKLHPKLLKCIIQLFTNICTNKKGAQLVLTSHDITTMNSNVYRRDEIWFCALNPENASSLYSLIAFRKQNGKPPRSDETYGKQYLEGRYGADPYIRRILDWEDACE